MWYCLKLTNELMELTKEEKIAALQRLLDNTSQHFYEKTEDGTLDCCISILADRPIYGLCRLSELLLTRQERIFIYNLMNGLILDNKIHSNYIWTMGKAEPRRQWLIKQIEKLQNE